MKRFEIYLDNDNRLNIDVYSDIESDYESKKFKGKACYDVIKKISEHYLIKVR